MSDPTAGALQIATGLSAFFLGCLVLQGYIYLSKYPRDPKWIKYIILVIILLELGLHISLTELSYTISIVHAGDPLVFFRLPSSWPISSFFSVFTMPICEAFYCWRIYKLTRTIWPSLSGIVLSLFRTCGWIYYLRRSTIIGPIGMVLDTQLRWLAMLLLLLAVVVNVPIVAMMTIHLSKHRHTSILKTRELIDRLIVWTVSTGMLAMIPHIAAFALFVTMKETLVWMCILPVSTKVFANCLLSTLNNRPARAEDLCGSMNPRNRIGEISLGSPKTATLDVSEPVFARPMLDMSISTNMTHTAYEATPV